MINKVGAARGGRPSKLTGTCQHLIVEALTQGASLSGAARQATISERSIFRWKARGASEAAGTYRDFAIAVELALASAQHSQAAIASAEADVAALLRRALSEW